LRGIDKLAAKEIEKVEHIGAAPAVQLQHKVFRDALDMK
jgi:hypothetical protein